MTLHSYVKNGQDPNLIFFKEFVKLIMMLSCIVWVTVLKEID